MQRVEADPACSSDNGFPTLCPDIEQLPATVNHAITA